MTPTLHIVLRRRQPATWTDVRAMPGDVAEYLVK
jgi:hypothetical protein